MNETSQEKIRTNQCSFLQVPTTQRPSANMGARTWKEETWQRMRCLNMNIG